MARISRKITIKLTVFFITLLTTIFIAFQILLKANPSWFLGVKSNLGYFSYSSEKAFNGEKLIHLDLKGAVPSISYLKSFFPFIKGLGATGILIEYEDSFPYKKNLQVLRAVNAFNSSDISEILHLAESNGLTVIPLVQTFGHLEYVLKLDEFRHLREIDKSPQVVCPSNKEAVELIHEMIDQIIEAHPKSKYIHVGFDEVYYIGYCSKCENVTKRNNWTNEHLAFNHIKTVAGYINKKYPGVRPIMWNDVVITNNDELLKEFKIADMVDIMVWSHKTDVTRDVPDDLLKLYAKTFKSIWIASAFKGATGRDQMIVDAKHHFKNHMSWMDLVSKWERDINFKGIALTGWQRYDHFSPLCELLPVSIPSLALNLLYLRGRDRDLKRSLQKTLDCDSPVPLSRSDLKYAAIPECKFPGFPIYKVINQFYVLTTELRLPSSKVLPHWILENNKTKKISNHLTVEEYLDFWNFNENRSELKDFEESLRNALLKVYDRYTVKEWMNQSYRFEDMIGRDRIQRYHFSLED